jgi:hypothetical protein
MTAKHSMTAASTLKEIFQRESGMRKFSRRWVPHSWTDAQKVAHVEAAKKLLPIVQGLKKE